MKSAVKVHLFLTGMPYISLAPLRSFDEIPKAFKQFFTFLS